MQPESLLPAVFEACGIRAGGVMATEGNRAWLKGPLHCAGQEHWEAGSVAGSVQGMQHQAASGECGRHHPRLAQSGRPAGGQRHKADDVPALLRRRVRREHPAHPQGAFRLSYVQIL